MALAAAGGPTGPADGTDGSRSGAGGRAAELAAALLAAAVPLDDGAPDERELDDGELELARSGPATESGAIAPAVSSLKPGRRQGGVDTGGAEGGEGGGLVGASSVGASSVDAVTAASRP